VDSTNFKLSDNALTFCTTVFFGGEKNATDGRNGEHICKQVGLVLDELGVEIVGDLFLMRSHNLMTLAKQKMFNSLGAEDTEICWPFLEKTVNMVYMNFKT
jgi:hypothetical protein|tara:strand:- start:194 stop:496 length:303 start_codon:yes stop_codon:yes gene_type:complete